MLFLSPQYPKTPKPQDPYISTLDIINRVAEMDAHKSYIHSLLSIPPSNYCYIIDQKWWDKFITCSDTKDLDPISNYELLFDFL